MSKPFLFEVVEARSVRHPVFAGVQKHSFLIQASKLPHQIPTGANARAAVGMNRQVYKDVKESLKGTEAVPGSFDLMNLGITIIADSVELVDKTRGQYRVMIRDEDGIVNGAHTALIIEEAALDGVIPDEQHVDVKIFTGVDATGLAFLKPDIAKGQNTGIAVKSESILDKEGRFDSLKAIVSGEAWAREVAWRESDVGDVHVRDLICALEALNVIDFPNEDGAHPIHAYEKPSKALEKYAKDHKDHEADLTRRTFAAMEPLLLEALFLMDTIRHDFRPLWNKHVSPAAGRLRIVEEAATNKAFKCRFTDGSSERYRLTKGALFPIFASFRNCVQYDPATNRASWVGGFPAVLRLWDEAGPELVRETANAIKDVGHLPDQLGKARGHWSNLHRATALRSLRHQISLTTGA
ncbi:AIPR family protein [Brevundimonas sp.]|uniref:AIPR family protein n=1 Tax=Brevundimonas sp. TaxID=1871086 RepID=UPI0025FCFFFB|nr:AIPR family protein [Brevundimonas sp.]